MAITESDYLRIHKGDSSFILLRNPTHFHLIRIDADLSESRMERLLRIYPCDTDQLHKLGVHFSTFKASNLRGIVITGYQAGDTLELWLGGDIREYQLGSDYSDDVLAHFFKDHLITRRLPPKWEGLAPSIIRKITWSTNVISIACAIAFYFISTPYGLWSILCIMCQLSALILTLLYPASFTLADDSRKRKLYINKGKGHLLPVHGHPLPVRGHPVPLQSPRLRGLPDVRRRQRPQVHHGVQRETPPNPPRLPQSREQKRRLHARSRRRRRHAQ